MSVHAVLRDRLLARAGLAFPPITEPPPSREELAVSEWDKTFEVLMRNRLIMGALRYGRLRTEKPQFDRVASMRTRLGLYEATGNLEHLVDVANIALVEFVEGEHPNKHFSSVDDGHHAKPKSK